MTRPARFSARWIVPVTSAPIPDGALLVDARGRITHLGPRVAVPEPDDAEVVDLGEAALLPGLVNTHAHPDLAMLRGRIEDLAFPDWIAELLRIRRETPLTEPDFLAAARWSCIEMLRGGVTAVGATEDSAGAFTALRECGLRGVVYREVFGPDPAQAGAALAELRARVEAMRHDETDLVRVGVSPHSPISVSDALFSAVARYAAEERLDVAVHTAESLAEAALVVHGEGEIARRLAERGIDTRARARSTIDLLERAGLLERSPLLIHCVQIDTRDIDSMARSGARVAHCPIANARLGHGVAPVRELIAAGIAVGLGSDSVASNNRVDMLEEARAAQLFQRAVARSPVALPAADALRMATLDGARALGIDDRAGALRPGLDADLCAIRLDGPHVTPVHDPVSAIVHSARAADVVLTAVRGKILYRDGAVRGIDVAAARAAAEAVARRVGRPGPVAVSNDAPDA